MYVTDYDESYHSDPKPQDLARFIRKRDPRYKSHLAKQSEAAATKVLKGYAQSTPPKSSTPTPDISTYVEQAWQKPPSLIRDHADLEWAAAETAEDTEEWECVACGKSFRSEAAWDSHERSKKHMQAVERLKQEMFEEDEELALGLEQAELEDAEAEVFEDAREEEPAVPDGQSEAPPPTNIDGEKEDIPEEDEPQPKPSKKKKARKSRAPSPEPLSKTERKGKMRQQLSSEVAGDIDEALRAAGETSVAGSPVGSTTPLESGGNVADKPELSKREKRRAREAAKKAKEEHTPPTKLVRPSLSVMYILLSTIIQVCNVCEENFDSKTKLFSHINTTGHALASSAQGGAGGKKKGKAGKR